MRDYESNVYCWVIQDTNEVMDRKGKSSNKIQYCHNLHNCKLLFKFILQEIIKFGIGLSILDSETIAYPLIHIFFYDL